MIKAIRSLLGWLPVFTVLCLSSASGEAKALSDDLYSFQVMVGGDVISLPSPFEKMIKAGWSYAGNEGEILKPEQRAVSSAWRKNGVFLSGETVNTSWDVKPVKECMLTAVTLNASSARAVLPGGILLGISTGTDVMDTYGMPSSTYDEGNTFQYTYQLDYDQEAVFTFLAYSGILKEVTLRNAVMDDAPDPDALGDAAVPLYAYREPESLGEDPLAFRVMFGGALYELPAPVQAFIKNGWTVMDGSDRVVKAYGSGQLILSFAGSRFTTWVYNDSDRAALAGDCLVTTIVSDAARGDLPLLLPRGVTNGTTEEAALDAYQGLSFKAIEMGSLRRYVFYKDTSSIALSVQTSTGLVKRVEIIGMP